MRSRGNPPRPVPSRFRDRADAGAQLSSLLAESGPARPVVLGLPRGGVPVAAVVAERLRAPLDVIVVRKLGVPSHPELAMGAIGEDRVRLLDTHLVERLHITPEDVGLVEQEERRVLERRLAQLRHGRPALDLRGRTAVVVDDGLATGATARAACRVARLRHAARVVLAVPVAPREQVADLLRTGEADGVVAVQAVDRFRAVGEHYEDFGAVTDREVALVMEETRDLSEMRVLARPLRTPTDLDDLLGRARTSRFVCLGEASHGTREYYEWRAEITRRLVASEGFTWVGVEGDWPDCWRVNEWVRGLRDRDLDAAQVLAGFDRWPTWMWANRETADFLDWLRRLNDERRPEERVGFYGLDVYSLWDSLRQVMAWVRSHAPASVPTVARAWECFLPFRQDPHRYAASTRLVPQSCEAEVVAALVDVRRQAGRDHRDDALFDAVQNAETAAQAEAYYRAMVRGGAESWNIRDRHMVDTVARLSVHLGTRSKGILWAHNTHVGDARATDMGAAGMVNVGQLMRQSHHDEGVFVVGFAGHRGRVLAGDSWGGPERVMTVPTARGGSHEDRLHRALGEPAVLVFGDDRTTRWLSTWAGHRAIGVVYDPHHEGGNYVPTRLGARYDALVWFEQTRATRPLHHEARPSEPEYETEPTGY